MFSIITWHAVLYVHVHKKAILHLPLSLCSSLLLSLCSSTLQAVGHDSDVLLKPASFYRDPFFQVRVHIHIPGTCTHTVTSELHTTSGPVQANLQGKLFTELCTLVESMVTHKDTCVYTISCTRFDVTCLTLTCYLDLSVSLAI